MHLVKLWSLNEPNYRGTVNGISLSSVVSVKTYRDSLSVFRAIQVIRIQYVPICSPRVQNRGRQVRRIVTFSDIYECRGGPEIIIYNNVTIIILFGAFIIRRLY